MSGVYGYPNDPTSTTGTVGTGGGAGGVVVDEGNTTVAALNNAQRGLAGDMGMYRNDTSGKQTTGGSANAYTVTLESVPTALADGLGFSAIIHASNTGATTINVNSLGAKKVLYKGVALSGGELVAGQPARFSYDASADSAAGAWLIENPVPVPATVSYSASEIANDSGVTGTNVDDALNTLDTDKANLASPTLTGTPAAPTASAATNTTQIATTAFVQTELGNYAPLASPALTGNPTAPTQSARDNSTKLATTAYADSAAAAAGSWTAITDISISSGTTKDVTGIPSGTEEIFIEINDANYATNGASVTVALGDGGGLEASGYSQSNLGNPTFGDDLAAFHVSRRITIDVDGCALLKNVGSNTWMAVYHGVTGSASIVGVGNKTLSGELDRLRFAVSDGSAFTGGTIKVRYR